MKFSHINQACRINAELDTFLKPKKIAIFQTGSFRNFPGKILKQNGLTSRRIQHGLLTQKHQIFLTGFVL